MTRMSAAFSVTPYEQPRRNTAGTFIHERLFRARVLKVSIDISVKNNIFNFMEIKLTHLSSCAG